jgi:16S rRNA (guanine527-N7)-methyltransferase
VRVPSRDVDARILTRFKKFGVSATAAQTQQLGSYFGLLAKWNKTVNLTALELDPPSEIAIDRLLVEPFLAAGVIARRPGGGANAVGMLVDIGSGGGSPAIPLRIAIPGLQLRMVEAKARKSAFLREVVRQLDLADTEVLTARIEQLLPRPDLHEAADIVSIRAVRADRRLWTTLSAFTKPGGLVLWFKSQADSDQDQDAVFFPAFMLEAVEPLIRAKGSELAVLRKPN